MPRGHVVGSSGVFDRVKAKNQPTAITRALPFASLAPAGNISARLLKGEQSFSKLGPSRRRNSHTARARL
ncbi:MAG: hypothetical protein E5W15_01410 [Mesorhizobium sp.]|nr:MAG: hypothetical protein E5W15_01410 [Mesorhizobium sp.]